MKKLQNLKPLVSISCITYNHRNFIKDCLEGFLIQKTNFDYEILIHDDASNDGTSQILQEYQDKFPHMIRVIFQVENQYSKGQRGMNQRYNYPRARGKYIALCEGDDYWTDPCKLQKQVDFLEANQEFSACFTNATTMNEILGANERYIKSDKNQHYEIKEIIRKGGALFPTASLVFRNQIKDWPDYIFKHQSGDRALAMVLADKGDFYLLNEVTCIYRRHSGGVFSSVMKNQEKRREIDESNIELLKDFNEYTRYKYQETIKKIISKRAFMVLLNESKNFWLLKDDELFGYLTFNDILRLFKNKILPNY